MPRKELPAKISRNDKTPTTQAQKEAIEAIDEWYDQLDHITEIADKTDYSTSHVGQCYREFFDAASEKSKTDIRDTSNKVVLETPDGTYTCESDDPEVRKAFASKAPELVV